LDHRIARATIKLSRENLILMDSLTGTPRRRWDGVKGRRNVVVLGFLNLR